MGTGPFMFEKWVRGSYLEVKRNPHYFRPQFPYLDGAKYYMIKDLSARAKSVRAGRTDVEFRGFPPAEVEAIKKQLGDQVTVRYPKAIIHWGVAINADDKPFNDERVRKALTLALDRYDMARVLGPLTGLETVGGLGPSGHALGHANGRNCNNFPGLAKIMLQTWPRPSDCWLRRAIPMASKQC